MNVRNSRNSSDDRTGHGIQCDLSERVPISLIDMFSCNFLGILPLYFWRGPIQALQRSFTTIPKTLAFARLTRDLISDQICSPHDPRFWACRIEFNPLIGLSWESSSFCILIDHLEQEGGPREGETFFPREIERSCGCTDSWSGS